MQTETQPKTQAETQAEARTRTRKWIQAAILLLLGLYFLETLLTGEIAFYINERFNWLALVGGLIFLAMGVSSVVALLSERRSVESEHQHAHEHDHEHAHEHTHDHGHHHGHHHHAHSQAVAWPALAIICVPLVLGILLPARPLGASAISGGVTTSINVASSRSAQFTLAPTERNVLDWVRAFSASASLDEFIGQPADVLGFVYRDVRFSEDTEFMVTRFTVSCCVADAVPIGVIVTAENADQFPQDSWVRVRGKFQVREFDGHKTPVLVAESIEPTTMPDRPYLFP